MREHRGSGTPKRLNPVGIRLTPEQEKAEKIDRARLLKVLFAQGPIYGAAPPYVARAGTGTSHGPNESFRRLRLNFVNEGASVEVSTAVLDRLGVYLCELGRIPFPDEHLATEGVTAQVLLPVDGAERLFDTWAVAGGGTVAAATVGDRAILLYVQGGDLAGLELQRLPDLAPFLPL